MTDIRADDSGGLEEDRLPWLEAVDEDERGGGPSALKTIVGVLILLVGIGALVGGAYWIWDRYGQSNPATGDAELIKAPEGDYKVRPDDPGGMAVEGEGGTAFKASEGQDPKGAINPNGVAETPLQKGAQPAIIPAPAPTPAEGQQPAQQPQPAAGGATIQLGAFSSQASASSAWKALSGRFKYLAPLTHSIVPVTVGGKTLYRLRASGPDAASICGRLRVAGESCAGV
jgi:hypothetical protein